MIRAEHLYFSYDQETPILQDLSFSIEKGETVGLVGANGAGKSTLLKLLVGLAGGYEGRLQVGGLAVEKKNLPAIRAKIGYVFQDADSQLFMNTVYDDLAFGPRNYGFSAEEVEARVQRAMEETGTQHLRNKPIYQMSGGEKRLVAIATILAMEPEVILMDEPEASLDPRNRRRLIRLLNELTPARFIASHDLDMILDTCSRVILMSHGTIAADGPAREILTDRALLEAHDLELPLRLQG